MASRQQRRDRLIFLVPSMTVLTVLLVYPLAYSLGLSFYNYYLPVPRTTFIGLDNFRFILGDDAFWEALDVTARFTGAAVALEVVLGVAVALLLDARIPCRRSIRRSSISPSVTVRKLRSQSVAGVGQERRRIVQSGGRGSCDE